MGALRHSGDIRRETFAFIAMPPCLWMRFPAAPALPSGLRKCGWAAREPRDAANPGGWEALPGRKGRRGRQGRVPRFRRHGGEDGTRGFGSQLSAAPRGTFWLVRALD